MIKTFDFVLKCDMKAFELNYIFIFYFILKGTLAIGWNRSKMTQRKAGRPGAVAVTQARDSAGRHDAGGMSDSEYIQMVCWWGG